MTLARKEFLAENIDYQSVQPTMMLVRLSLIESQIEDLFQGRRELALPPLMSRFAINIHFCP